MRDSTYLSGGGGVAKTVLDELTWDGAPGPTRALPLDLDCYLAIKKGWSDRALSECSQAGGGGRSSDRSDERC